MIDYKDIPEYCDRVDNSKKTTVTLSKTQAWLFKNLTKNRLKPLHGAFMLFDIAGYLFLLTWIFFFSRNLFLLSYFYRPNDACSTLMEFKEIQRGKIAVTFNPRAQEMEW